MRYFLSANQTGHSFSHLMQGEVTDYLSYDYYKTICGNTIKKKVGRIIGTGFVNDSYDLTNNFLFLLKNGFPLCMKCMKVLKKNNNIVIIKDNLPNLLTMKNMVPKFLLAEGYWSKIKEEG